MRYLFIILLLFLTGCKTIERTESSIIALEDSIKENHELILDRASISAHATSIFIHEGNLDAAKVTHEFTIKALPKPKLYLSEEWDNIVKELNIDHTESKTLKSEYRELGKLESEEFKLGKSLDGEKRKLISLLKNKIAKVEQELFDAKNFQNLRGKLVYIFAGASVLLVVAGIFSFKFMKGMSINFFLAAGGFALAAYYVTTTWFAFIAAGIGIIVVIGVGYMVIGGRKPTNTLRGVIKGIEKYRKNAPEDTSKLEVDLSRTLNDGEKALIRKEKQRVKHELVDEDS